MPHHIDIVSRIQERFNLLRKSEQKVAKMILADLHFAAKASINELALKAGVSEASITRVAKGLGVKNVRDLKMQLAQSIAVGERFINETVAQTSSIQGVYDAAIKALDNNRHLIDHLVIEQCCQHINQAKQIYIFGIGGSSTILAQECQYRLFRLGYAVNAQSDPMLMRMNASSLDKNDVVIGLSISGFSPDVCQALAIAKSYGATTIGICPSSSQLSDTADIFIPIAINEDDYIFKPSASRFVMMAAIDVLAMELAATNPKKSREKLRRIKHNLDLYRQGSAYLPLGD